MSDYDHAPTPMALDDVRLADSGESDAPTPVDLGTLEAAADAPSPAPLGLIGSVEEGSPSPDATMGGGEAVGAVAGADAAPEPSPAQGTPPGIAAVETGPPGPMDLDQLNQLEQR